MTSTLSATDELTAARARNESVWRASAVALYAGDIETFLAHWTDNPTYEVAYPVDGFPARIEGVDQFRAMFGGFAAAARSIGVTDVRLHQTDDPDLIFVEERMAAELHDGSRYEDDLVIRVRFADGRIEKMFEYYGERAHQELARRLGAA